MAQWAHPPVRPPTHPHPWSPARLQVAIVHSLLSLSPLVSFPLPLTAQRCFFPSFSLSLSPLFSHYPLGDHQLTPFWVSERLGEEQPRSTSQVPVRLKGHSPCVTRSSSLPLLSLLIVTILFFYQHLVEKRPRVALVNAASSSSSQAPPPQRSKEQSCYLCYRYLLSIIILIVFLLATFLSAFQVARNKVHFRFQRKGPAE